MAKSKKSRNKKKPQQVKLKPENYIRKHARKSPVYECLIDEQWRQTQFTPVIVSRQKAGGRLIGGVYIVDMQCLGLKNTSYYHDMDVFEYQEFVQRMAMGMNQHFVPIEPNLCFNVIYGAVEFAEDCGFPPHKDFAVTEYILDDVESIKFVEIPLGKDGKPFYFAGPYDDSRKILETLSKNVGPGNFDFVAEIGDTDDDWVIEEDDTAELELPPAEDDDDEGRGEEE